MIIFIHHEHCIARKYNRIIRITYIANRAIQLNCHNMKTRSLAIAKRPCDCCIILKSGSYTKAI